MQGLIIVMRTEQSFFVPKQEIVDNGYDLSINKYKKTEYVTVEYPSTAEILDKLDTLETEIQKRLIELRGDAIIIKLGSVITEYSERNKNGENIPVNSVTNEQGLTPPESTWVLSIGKVVRIEL